ncbi:histidine kinase [Cohnella sp.]|uniref:GAF domain-containing sensor histidine kinase n=1 Tax=Cohnella sp. TaxID=1883426 RepID=UPI003563399C
MKTMRILRLLVGLFFAATAVLYLKTIPGYYDTLLSQCFVDGCGLSVPPLVFVYGFPAASTTAALLVAIDCALTAAYYASAATLLWKGAREPMGIVAALAMVSFGTSFPVLAVVGTAPESWTRLWFDGVSAIGWMSLSLFCLLFPNGRFVPSWSRYSLLPVAALVVANLAYGGNFWESAGWPGYLQLIWFLCWMGLLISAQAFRFRHISSPAERQQTKWVVYGVAVGIAGYCFVALLFEPAFHQGRALYFIGLNASLHLVLSAIPATLALAVLRKRLWDINPLVNRTILYGALTACVVLIYTAIVLYLGALIEHRNDFIVSLIATGIVAAAFGPLKERLQRLVNRWMKGRHDDPYAVLLELGNRMMQPITPQEMLEATARQVKEALRLPYAGIAVGIAGQETLLAKAGELRDQSAAQAFPIVLRGDTLGTLYAACRSEGEAFSVEDEIFLQVLLRHIAPIVNNADMLRSLARLAEDLQDSRERLIVAREEERRRLRNNLHDDLAPKLAALALHAATARKFVDRDPAAASAMLDELARMIRASVEDIRTLVRDMRPTALDQLGLIGAIRARMEEMAHSTSLIAGVAERPGPKFRFEPPESLPGLSAAVEVAAYRIVTESIVNVVKHAQASVCEIRLGLDGDSWLRIEVTDDGIGVASRSDYGASGGIGLLSIRERAAEIGGECGMDRPAGGGTRVWAILPL